MSRFFQPSELACKCGRLECNAAPMDPYAIIKLDGVRLELGEPMKLTSARRCEYWNSSPTVKGAKDSQHLYGRAVDCWCPNGAYAMRVLKLAIKHGFVGVGVGKTFIHMDTRQGPPVLFSYKC